MEYFIDLLPLRANQSTGFTFRTKVDNNKEVEKGPVGIYMRLVAKPAALALRQNDISCLSLNPVLKNGASVCRASGILIADGLQLDRADSARKALVMAKPSRPRV